MLDTTRTLIRNQFDAALSTLNACIVRCPDEAWDAPVANLAFCQVVFHALFFTDVYLERHEGAYRDQPFHRDHPEFFRDYEEMEYRRQVLLYDRPTIRAYLQHCRHKAATAIAAETVETLSAPCGFQRRDFSRGELYVFTLRHIQHHAAQLALRLRLDHGEEVPWFASGWREA